MIDETEDFRRNLTKELSIESDRERLIAEYGQVWDTNELTNAFEVKSFLAPFVSVKRKSDNKTGTMLFQDRPRFYFKFKSN